MTKKVLFVHGYGADPGSLEHAVRRNTEVAQVVAGIYNDFDLIFLLGGWMDGNDELISSLQLRTLVEMGVPDLLLMTLERAGFPRTTPARDTFEEIWQGLAMLGDPEDTELSAVGMKYHCGRIKMTYEALGIRSVTYYTAGQEDPTGFARTVYELAANVFLWLDQSGTSWFFRFVRWLRTKDRSLEPFPYVSNVRT